MYRMKIILFLINKNHHIQLLYFMFFYKFKMLKKLTNVDFQNELNTFEES